VTPSFCAAAISRSASARAKISTAPLAPPRRASDGSACSAARAAEMIDQRAKGARADIGTADQAQPIDPLLVR